MLIMSWFSMLKTKQNSFLFSLICSLTLFVFFLHGKERKKVNRIINVYTILLNMYGSFLQCVANVRKTLTKGRILLRKTNSFNL